jgi:hypothetical protein
MAEYTIDKISYGGNTYVLQDTAAEEAINDIAEAMPVLEEFTTSEIAALVLEYPTGSTPLSSASGVSF